MELINSKTKGWSIDPETRQISTPEGIGFSEELSKDLCKNYSIPATLLKVDEKFGTSTLLSVAKSATPEVTFVRDEVSGALSVLDPKASAVDDAQFESFVEELTSITGISPERNKKGLRSIATFHRSVKDSDEYLSDVFSKNLSIFRNPTGGVTLSTGIVRLACTNGMMVHDRQYTLNRLDGNLDQATMKLFSDQVDKFDVPAYLQRIFTFNGEPLSASVENYIDMRRCLARITNDEQIADLLYPMSPIESFYEEQGIDISKINTKYLHTLPSGLSYYECLNILTNGAKAAEQTLANKISVAAFASPRRIEQLKNTDLHWVGTPHFDRSDLLFKMGDTKAAVSAE